MNVNFVILIENGYVLHACCEGDVLRDTTIGNEKVVEGTQNDFLNLHRIGTMMHLNFSRSEQPYD